MYAGPDLKSSPYSSLLGNVLKYICKNSNIVESWELFLSVFLTRKVLRLSGGFIKVCEV